MDYFALFDLPATFDIDTEQLNARFQALQRQFHPDRFAACAETERLRALQQAATINQACQTLRQPLSRAEYLLSLHGIDIRNEQHTLHDNTFLQQQFELREKLDALESSVSADAELPAFMQQINDSIRQYTEQLRQSLNAQRWPEAADTVRKLLFLAKLRDQTEQLEEKLLDL